METTYIATANIGGYDELRPQATQDVPVEWVCFTDEELEPWQTPSPWQTLPVEPRRGEHPNLFAKRFKMRGPRRWIWIDANIEITSPSFARQAFRHVNDGLAVYRHPRRDCIYDEAEASVGVEGQDGKYAGQPIREQAAAYREIGHPKHAGLYACGIIAWDGADPRLGRAWLDECRHWSFQDQISFPVVCRELGIRPGTFPHPQITRSRIGYLENPWLRIHARR